MGAGQLSEYGVRISDAARQYFLPQDRQQIQDNTFGLDFQQLLLQKMNMAMGMNNQFGSGDQSLISSPAFSPFAEMMQMMMFQNGNAFTNQMLTNPTMNQALSSYGMQQYSYVQNGASYSSKESASIAGLDDIIRQASQQYGVDEKLIHAIIKMESNYNPNTVSHAGAVGLMQLMPVTAREVGVTDRYDIKQNVFGGTHYFSKMLQRHNGDLKLALASYNAGPGNVKKYGGVPPFKETQNYIRKVMDFYVRK